MALNVIKEIFIQCFVSEKSIGIFPFKNIVHRFALSFMTRNHFDCLHGVCVLIRLKMTFVDAYVAWPLQ